MPTKAQLLLENERVTKENKRLKNKISSLDKKINSLVEEVNNANEISIGLDSVIEKNEAVVSELKRQNKNIDSYVELSWFKRAIQSKDSIKSWLK
jgi:hypothetical protein